MKKYHIYTEDQLAYLGTVEVPSPSNKKEVEAFKVRFEKKFSHLSDWTPAPKAATLVAKAMKLQIGRVEFSPPVRVVLDEYLGRTLEPDALRQITEHASLIAGFTYLESDIVRYLEEQAEQAGGLDRPVLEPEPLPEQKPLVSKPVETPAIQEVIEAPSPKKETPAKEKKITWRIMLNDEVLWEGEKKPSIDIPEPGKGKKFYLIVKDEILWSGNSKPSPWICQKY